MNVASRELCKELYKLSGWDGTDYMYERWASRYNERGYADYQLTNTKNALLDKRNGILYDAPFAAYDLGYLVRKIPEFEDKEYCVRKFEGKWQIWEHEEGWYDENGNHVYYDTPEDAAAKLAIELFKQGVLKP